MGVFLGVLAVVALREYVAARVLDCCKFIHVEVLVDLFEAAVLVSELTALAVLAKFALPEGPAVLSLENLVSFQLIFGQPVNCVHLLKPVGVIARVAKSAKSGVSPVLADVPLVLPGMQKIKNKTKDVRHQSLICQQNLSEVTNVFIRGQQFRDEQNKKEKLNAAKSKKDNDK